MNYGAPEEQDCAEDSTDLDEGDCFSTSTNGHQQQTMQICYNGHVTKSEDSEVLRLVEEEGTAAHRVQYPQVGENDLKAH